MSYPQSNALAQPTPQDGIPSRRLKTAMDGVEVAQNLQRAALQRDFARSKLKGMIDGNPPYVPEKLKANGQGYRANFNTMEGAGTLDTALTPYYDIFAAAPLYASVELDVPEEQAEYRTLWNDVVSNEFDAMLRNWCMFDYAIQAMIFDFVTFGKGILVFCDNATWHFDHVCEYLVRVPDRSKASVDKQDIIAVVVEYKAHELYSKIRNEEAARSAGWNIEAVYRAMYSASPEETKDPHRGWMEYQQRLKDRDLCDGTSDYVVKTATLYVKEFDGSITQAIVPLVAGYGNRAPQPPEKVDWLYYKPKAYTKMSQAVKAFFFQIGDGSWNGVTGLGRAIYSLCEAKTRLLCTALDLAAFRGSIILQAQSQAAVSNAALTKIGPLTVLPPDYTVQQSAVLGDVDTQVEMHRALDWVLATNTGVYKQDLSKPKGNPRTAEEVRLQYQTTATLSSSAVSRFTNQLDELYREIYARATATRDNVSDHDEAAVEAKAFIDRCVARGVPRALLKKAPKRVVAYRSFGNGSSFMRQNALTSMLQLYPEMTEQGRKNFQRMFEAAFAGRDMVGQFFTDMPSPELQHQEAFALLENGVINTGSPVMVTTSDDHLQHAMVHLMGASQQLQRLEGGADPASLLGVLEEYGKHIGDHVQREKRQDSPQIKAVLAQLQQLGAVHDQLAQRLQEQQESQAELERFQSGQDPDTQIKLQKAQLDRVLKEQKTQLQMNLKREQVQQNMAIKDATAAQQIRNARLAQEKKAAAAASKAAE